MDEVTLFNLLKSAGLPVASSKGFASPPTPPYIIYSGDGLSKLVADNKVYHKEKNYRVELYTKVKDPATEKKLEDLFDANEIDYDKSEDVYIQSEDLLMVYYTI